MKKLLASVSAMSLATLGMTVVSIAPASAGSVSDFCTAFGDFGGTHGACVGGIQKSVPEFCKALNDAFPGVFFKNNGECVSLIKQFINNP